MKRKLKIAVINPNSSEEMSQDIAKAAKKYAAGRFEVITIAMKSAPDIVDFERDIEKTESGLREIVRDYEGIADAFVISCHYDPNVMQLRRAVSKPVIGIGEAAFRLASILGIRFTVIDKDENSVAYIKGMISRYGMERSCASVRVPEEGKTEEEAYMQTIYKAVREDLADVIVVGCEGQSAMVESIRGQVNVPVLDGMTCGLIIAEGMANAGYRTSRAWYYSDRPDFFSSKPE